MRIISLNAWRGAQREALDAYFEEQKEITDIFLLQEAGHQCDELRAKHLFLWQSVTTRKYEKSYDEELYETSVFRSGIEVVATGIFFSDNPNQGSGIWSEILVDGERYIVCNIHGTSYPAEKYDTEDRINQTKEILAFLKGRPGKHIIMGDFNLFPDTTSVALFEEAGYKNLIKEYNIDTTRNEIAWVKYPDNKHLFADYAFVSTDVDIVDFQVPKNEISDHLPMELTIR